jgi:hypothetical protein
LVGETFDCFHLEYQESEGQNISVLGRFWESEIVGTGSGSFPMAGFGIRSIWTSSTNAAVLVRIISIPYHLHTE